MEWIAAFVVFAGLLALLPLILRSSRETMRARGSTPSPLGRPIRNILTPSRIEAMQDIEREKELPEQCERQSGAEKP